jgi:hypothetical protein
MGSGPMEFHMEKDNFFILMAHIMLAILIKAMQMDREDL